MTPEEKQALINQGMTVEQISQLESQQQQQAMAYTDPTGAQAPQQSQAPMANPQAQRTEAPVAAEPAPIQEGDLGPVEGYTPDPRIAQLETQQRQMSGKRSKNDFSWSVSPATDSEAIGEGLFVFGLKLLASSSRPGATFGEGLAEGLAAGTDRFMGALNRNKRFENIEKLQEKGYNDESIDSYLMSGDSKVLSKDPVEKKQEMKITEVNGVKYSYDPRDPANTMVALGKSIRVPVKEVRLGDKVEVWYNDGTMEVKPIAKTPGTGGSGSGSKSKAPKPAEFDQVWIDPKTDEPVYYRYDVDEDGNTVRVAADANQVIPANGVHLPYDKYASTYGEKSKGRSERIEGALDLYEKSNNAQYTARSIRDNPNLNKITGQIDTRTFTIFDDASNLEVELSSLGGQTFLTAFERLKGGGQITEIEGKQAKDALLAVFNPDGSLKASVSADALRKALDAYDKTMEYSKRIAEIEETGSRASIKERKQIFSDVFVAPGQQVKDEKSNREAEWDKKIEIDKAEKDYKGPPQGQVGFVPPAYRAEWEYMERRPDGKVWGRKHSSSKLVVVQ